jgi:hypothetical protein
MEKAIVFIFVVVVFVGGKCFFSIFFGFECTHSPSTTPSMRKLGVCGNFIQTNVRVEGKKKTKKKIGNLLFFAKKE